MHARGPEDAERALHKIVPRVRGADDGEIFAGFRNFLDADLHVHRFGRFDTRVEHRYQAMFLFDSGEQFAELRLVGELGGADDLRRAFYMNLAGLAFATLSGPFSP